ncbi:MAG: hypothetical protein RR454_00080 [Clostridia bacterium]
MDIKCKNCNQFYDENDRFCRYCGCPNPIVHEEKKETARTLKQVQNEIDERATIIKPEKIAEAQCFPQDKIIFKKEGAIATLNTHKIVLTVVYALAIFGLIILSFVTPKFDISYKFRMIIMTLSLLFVIVFAGLLWESIIDLSAIRNLLTTVISIKKSGYNKKVRVNLEGISFLLEVDEQCMMCDGEIKGDLHIEKIDNKFVVVCNYNRAHFWAIDLNKLIEYKKGNNEG